MLPEAAGRGQLFQAGGHSFSLYGPTLSRSITCLSFFFPVVNWLTSEFVYTTLLLNWLTRRLQTICKKSNKRYLYFQWFRNETYIHSYTSYKIYVLEQAANINLSI